MESNKHHLSRRFEKVGAYKKTNKLYFWLKYKPHKDEVSYLQTIADGLRMSVGEHTFPIIKRLVDDVITVTGSNLLPYQCMLTLFC